ncbi:MAG: hypothetical protein ACREQV_11280, partial [Candidatus Binatia bacterium]
WNRDMALRRVQKYMQLESKEAAEAFLSRMEATADELDSEYDKVWDETVCRHDAPRGKEALYQMLDQMDDLERIKSHNAYVKFMSSLDERQEEAMTAWLEEDKEGFSYWSAEHKSTYEKMAVDVENHVDTVCAAKGNPR